MPELWLKFTGPDGTSRRVRVDGSKFVIGRHSDSDLAIADSRLSRVHAYIELFAGRWEISDAGSSNGTEVNGSPAFDAIPIYDGSTISLGGLQVKVEISEPAHEPLTSVEVAPPHPAPARPKAAAVPGRSVPVALFVAIPVLALILVAVAGGVAYLAFAPNTTVALKNINADDTPPDEDPPLNSKDPDDTPAPSSTPSNSGTPGPPTPKPANLGETAKIEVNAAAFMRKIAKNDPKPFLTTDQAKRLGSKIKQVSGSSAISDNLKSAKQNASQISAVAAQTSFKPHFLAVAAVTKLGNSRGDVVATARSIGETLEKVYIHIGTELGDDCLLLIAAYDQAVAGDTMKLRNMIQKLTNEVSESPRTIRTIWFLEKKQKITAAEFDRALTFLAIGTIAQNPKEFGVNTDVLDI